MCFKGSSVGRLLLIDAVSSVAVLGVWYLLFSNYNRKKGALVMRWVQTACAGKGRIVESHWLGSSRLQAKLHFPSRWFENSRVTVKLQPRALPLRWLLSCWRRQKETLTFEADLGGSPSFHLEVVRHRWSAHNRSMAHRDEREWDVYHPSSIILTTRTHWKQDPSAGTQRTHVGPAPGNCAGPLPPRVAAVLSHRAPGGFIRPRGSRRLCHHPARDRCRSLCPPAVGKFTSSSSASRVSCPLRKPTIFR